MSPDQSPDGTTRRDVPPPQVRLAGLLVGLQGLVSLAFGIALVVRSFGTPEIPVRFVLGEAGYFVVVAAGMIAVGTGLVLGRRWGRTPAIVSQLLLLPVIYSLLGPSQQLVWGVVCGVVVFATFMLLISERSRAWSMDLPERPGR